MEITDSELKSHLGCAQVLMLLTSGLLEVTYFDGKYYCVTCYENNKGITVLHNIRDSLDVFNCPYCSSIRVFHPTDKISRGQPA